MDELLIKILACPLHKDSELLYLNEKKCFLCNSCKKEYKIITVQNTQVPDFLINQENINRGFRGLQSSFLETVQGKPFKRQIEEKETLLDIGCGENPRGNINVDCYIPNKIPRRFVLANAEYLPFKDASIDIVLSNYSIEHMIDPANFIRNIYKITKEKVEIVTDNSEWLGDVFFRLIGKGRIFHDEHYYKWSVEYFRNLLSKLGYQNKVYLLNLSTSPIVKLFSVLGNIPRVGNFFYRDLKAEIYKK